MNFDSFLLMRHELVLLIVALLVLVTEIFISDKNRNAISPIAISLFAIHTIIGFLPQVEGSLFGGMYNTSVLLVTMKNILNIGVLIILFMSYKWAQMEDYKTKISEFYILIFTTLLGMNYMISSGDFLMFYLGLETATIPIAALAAYDRYKTQSAEAGIKLILSSALSSGILLYGISVIYGIYGTVQFAELSTLITAQSVDTLFVLGLIMFFSGMAFKLSLVPFHLWAADVYEGAPVPVTSYLSVISKGAAVFIFTIILYTVFKAVAPMWQDVVYVVAIITITVGNLFALRQKNMKRFLAFSSIAQAGFLLIGLISGTALGMATIVYYVLVYILSNLTVFGVVNIIQVHTGKESMDDYDGLYKTNPKLTLALMLGLFSLAGIPPVAGFFGKFFLFTAAAEKGYYILVLIALINTIVSLYYYLMPVKAMFINKNENPIPFFKSDVAGKIALLTCIFGMLIVGFASTFFETILKYCFGI